MDEVFSQGAFAIVKPWNRKTSHHFSCARRPSAVLSVIVNRADESSEPVIDTSRTSCSRESSSAMCRARMPGPAIFLASVSPVTITIRRRVENSSAISNASTSAS